MGAPRTLRCANLSQGAATAVHVDLSLFHDDRSSTCVFGWTRGGKILMVKGQVSRRALLVAAPLLAAPSLAAAQSPVIYYNQGNGLAAETTFGFKVLQLALAKSGRRSVLKPSPLGRVTEPRAIAAIASRNQMDVAMLGTSAVADASLAAVRLPIDRGLLGYRLLLIDRARQAEFLRVRDLRGLCRLSALQGKGWPDVDILRQAGVTVWTGAYEKLFAMTLARRGDFFPRGVLEAYGELARMSPANPGLAVETSLLLRYRFTSMFYVSKANQALHADLYRGFIRAFEDGSYQRLFDQDETIQGALARANLRHRRVIDIENPNLSAATSAIAERFWFQP